MSINATYTGRVADNVYILFFSKNFLEIIHKNSHATVMANAYAKRIAKIVKITFFNINFCITGWTLIQTIISILQAVNDTNDDTISKFQIYKLTIFILSKI